MFLVLMAFGTQLWYEYACKSVFVFEVLNAELAASSTFSLLGTFF